MKKRLHILDLYCCAGGAARGYYDAFTEAGYEVDITGVDIAPQKNYPYAMRVGDALTWPLRGYDFIHASPPCQDHSPASNPGKRTGVTYETGWMLRATYERLRAVHVPWIIENVAAAPMRHPVMLCGTSLGLRVQRHRLFDSSHLLYPAGACRHTTHDIGVYGGHAQLLGPGWATTKKTRAAGLKNPPLISADDARQAMGIDWMTMDELCQAIPPAYTYWLGLQIANVMDYQRQEAA